MQLTNFDLFGHPVVVPPSVTPHPVRRRVVSQEAKRAKLVRHLEQTNNLLLFEELLDFLKAPLLNDTCLPAEYSSDVGGIAVCEEEEQTKRELEEARAATIQIPYEPWGECWVTDDKGLHWSREGLLFVQMRLFWRSMEELALANNENEKWDILKWIFRPAIWKHYVYDVRKGQSQCFEVHERDDPFSFHNCCMSACMEEDAIREGVRRNIPAYLIKAVEKVCRFD